MNLIINWYYDKNPIRQAELFHALYMNLLSPHIEKIITLGQLPIEHKKILSKESDRPTFEHLFAEGREGINIIANSDIIFDDSILHAETLKSDECYALSRYEEDGTLNDFNGYSQDAWIFNGQPKGIEANFTTAIKGCDNRLAYEIQKAGYKITNPCKTIKIHHCHESGVRNYGKEKIPRPYLQLLPE